MRIIDTGGVKVRSPDDDAAPEPTPLRTSGGTVAGVGTASDLTFVLAVTALAVAGAFLSLNLMVGGRCSNERGGSGGGNGADTHWSTPPLPPAFGEWANEELDWSGGATLLPFGGGTLIAGSSGGRGEREALWLAAAKGACSVAPLTGAERLRYPNELTAVGGETACFVAEDEADGFGGGGGEHVVACTDGESVFSISSAGARNPRHLAAFGGAL